MVKKYLVPFLAIILSSLVLTLVRSFVFLENKDVLVTIVTAIVMFLYGTTLNDHVRSKNDTWLKKMIIMALFVVALLINAGVINIPTVNKVLQTAGVVTAVWYMLFIYLGYLFFS